MWAIFIFPVTAVSAWVIYSSLRHLRRGEVAAVWRSRVVVLLVIGLLLGLFFAFIKTSQPTAQFALKGFPVPTTIHRLENDIWVQNELPFLLKIAGHISNIAFGIALALLPLKIVGLINQARPPEASRDEMR